RLSGYDWQPGASYLDSQGIWQPVRQPSRSPRLPASAPSAPKTRIVRLTGISTGLLPTPSEVTSTVARCVPHPSRSGSAVSVSVVGAVAEASSAFSHGLPGPCG